MTGLDKIIEHIKQDAQTEADAKMAEAKAQAEEMLAKAAEEERAFLADVKARLEAELALKKERAASAAALAERKMLLETKQEIIAQTLAAVKEELLGLPDEAYFEKISAMVKKHALAQDGVIVFSKKDKARIPASFKETLKSSRLTLGEETREIDGGFILLYGDIEENCSFDALIMAAKEELQDKVRDFLFA